MGASTRSVVARVAAYFASIATAELVISHVAHAPSYVPLLPVGTGVGVGIVAAMRWRHALPLLAVLVAVIATSQSPSAPSAGLRTSELVVVALTSLMGGWSLKGPYADPDRGQVDLVMTAMARLTVVTLVAGAIGAALSGPTSWSNFGWSSADWALAVGASVSVFTRLTHDVLRPSAGRAAPRHRTALVNAFGVGAFLLAFGAVSGLFFAMTPNAGERLEYLVGPLTLFLILECSQRAIRVQVALIAVVAAVAFGLGQGPFSDVAGLHLFLNVSSLVTFVGGATLSERSAANAALAHRAHHDALTELANRTLLTNRLATAVSAPRKTLVGILMVDLDGFKDINDRLGHDAGDTLLKEVSARLLRSTRPVDTVARLGGDEFAVLLSDIDAASQPAAMAERLLAAIAKPVEINGSLVAVRASIGIAVASTDTAAAATLLSDADIAMFAAKDRGKGCAVRFEAAMRTALVERLELRRMLSDALDGHQLSVNYQPIFATRTGRVFGVEALVRWHHKERGLISPDDFVDVAEKSGLIGEMGRFVLDEAISQLARWRALHPDQVSGWKLSVNISPRQLTDSELPEFLASCLAANGIEPAAVILELTENSLLTDFDQAVHSLGQLRDLGVRIALDDYGSGHASVSYLRRLPVDILKIDRTLVAELRTASKSETAYVQNLLTLGRALNLTVIAEGVETPQELAALSELNCELVQGFLLARPLTSTAIDRHLYRGEPFFVPPSNHDLDTIDLTGAATEPVPTGGPNG